jgi:YebC/PmpR family DNA-binding regulatory protein
VSGHSKWSSIKHKKGAVDAKRGKLFSKLTRAIIVAAKEGGPDPAANLALQNAVEKAKAASMPKDNIDRAIAKGAGTDSDSAAYETVVYEGYGPAGVALIVESLTDNRNRTAGEVRHIFDKNDGNLGTPGAVAWLFERRTAPTRTSSCSRRPRGAPTTCHSTARASRSSRPPSSWRRCARRSRTPVSRSSRPS